MKKLLSAMTTVLLAAGWTLVTAGPASAVCHIVSISADPSTVEEKNTSVKVTISRGIFQSGCTANIDYTTSDDSAMQPADYTKTSGHCTEFDTNATAAKCTFTVPIKDDGRVEGNEKFNVSFSGTSLGPVSGSASVTIQDNDPSPTPPPPRTTTAPPKASPTASPTITAAPTTGASPGTPLVIAGTATPTGSPTPLAGGKTSDKKGASTGLIIGGIAILLAAGAGVGLWFLRKTPA